MRTDPSRTSTGTDLEQGCPRRLPLVRRWRFSRIMAGLASLSLALCGCEPSMSDSANQPTNQPTQGSTMRGMAPPPPPPGDSPDPDATLAETSPTGRRPTSERPLDRADTPSGAGTGRRAPSPGSTPNVPDPSSRAEHNPLAEFGYSQPDARSAAGRREDRRSDAQANQRLAIHLSAGVALPQSLPTGTAMGFSVDYQCEESTSQAYRYLWVIEPAGSKAAWSQPVRLKAAGTLQMFVSEFRPEDGPFQCYLVEVDSAGAPRRRTRSEDMQSF